MKADRAGSNVRRESLAIALWLCVATLLSTLCRLEAARPEYVTFPGPDGVTLSGILYTPLDYGPSRYGHPGMVLMHGCTGIWSMRRVNITTGRGDWDLQNHIEKWGLKLTSRNIVVLVVDSFSPRVPDDLSPNDRRWQNQCQMGDYPGVVDPYTTRVEDAQAGWTYLVSLGTVRSSRIGLLGWSQGAEATMTEAAATERDSDQVRTNHLFAVLAGFYPGCGLALGFGTVAVSSWWPYMEFMLNVGLGDDFFPNCESRVNSSRMNHPSIIINFPEYKLAEHSFDHKSQRWPQTKCILDPTSANAAECAMANADIDTLLFIEKYVLDPDPGPCIVPASGPLSSVDIV